jgi:MT-A70
MLSISERTLRTAKTVRDTACPEIVQAVRQGKLAVSVAAQAAGLAPEQQRMVVTEAEAGRANAVRQVVKREARARRVEALGARQRALPDERFGVILADPEWNRTTWSEAGMDRHAANHYPVSSDEIIASRPVAAIAAPDCVLGLWCTDPHRGVDLMRAWGFEPKSYFVWCKDIIETQPREPGAMLRKDDQLVVVGAAGNGYWRSRRTAVGRHARQSAVSGVDAR